MRENISVRIVTLQTSPFTLILQTVILFTFTDFEPPAPLSMVGATKNISLNNFLSEIFSQLTVFVSSQVRFGLIAGPGLAGFVDGHDPELIPFT